MLRYTFSLSISVKICHEAEFIIHSVGREVGRAAGKELNELLLVDVIVTERCQGIVEAVNRCIVANTIERSVASICVCEILQPLRTREEVFNFDELLQPL